MTTVTISPKHRLVVPKSPRQTLQLEPGQNMEVLVYERRFELVPVRDLKSVRGFLRRVGRAQ